MEKRFIVTKSQLKRLVTKAGGDIKSKLDKIIHSDKFTTVFDNTFGKSPYLAAWLSAVYGYDPNDEDMEGYSYEDIANDAGWAYDLIKEFFWKEEHWKQQWDNNQMTLAFDIFTKKRVPTKVELKKLA